jgi:hypothetical protein
MATFFVELVAASIAMGVGLALIIGALLLWRASSRRSATRSSLPRELEGSAVMARVDLSAELDELRLSLREPPELASRGSARGFRESATGAVAGKQRGAHGAF